jgi:two-component system, cell cycle sensor histidine kinase and response regulator CckA
VTAAPPDDELARLREQVERLEAELSGERAIRSALIDHSPDFIILCDLEGRIRFINRLAPGFRMEDVVGVPATSFASPRNQHDIEAAIAHTIATAELSLFETVVEMGPGQPTRFLNRVAPVTQGGAVSAVLWLATDVERLRHAEEEVRDRDDRLRIIVEAAQIGVWSLDVETGTVYTDLRTNEVFGQAGGMQSMDAALAVIAPEDRDTVVEAITGARTTGSYGPIEHRIVHPTGRALWVRAVGRLHRSADGKQHLIGGVVDITDQKRIEAELAQAQRLDSIGRLAGGIAHDFNNLLTAMFGSIDFALSTLPPDSPAARELDDIHSCATRGATLTAQLLAFARRQVLEPRVMTLSSLVADIEKILRRVLGEDIELAVVCHAEGRVRVDAHQIERVLVNLAANARDAMPDGGRLTLETIDVDLDESYATAHAEVIAGHYVMLAVSDTGAGIAPEQLPKIFEPFFTTKAARSGTGLGLATCYGIVRQAGGYIHAYSEVGHGTTFRIYLPRVDAPIDADVATETPRQSAGHETVLVVEDDAIVRRVTVRGLRQLGYEVLEASNGAEALDIAIRHGAVDLVLTDVVMPQMNGRELAERVRAAQPRIVVLFVSGYTANAIVHHGVLDPGIEFLAKPFNIAALHARIRKMLGER